MAGDKPAAHRLAWHSLLHHPRAAQGVCGYTDRFCGQHCLSGACTESSSPPPPTEGSDPLPDDDLPMNIDWSRFTGVVICCYAGVLLMCCRLPLPLPGNHNS